MFSESCSADAVQYDIDRIFFKNPAEIIRFSVDDDIGSESAYRFRFFIGADCCNDLCSERFCKLDRRVPKI